MSRISMALNGSPIGKMFLKETVRGMELYRVESAVIRNSTLDAAYRIMSCKNTSHVEVVAASELASLMYGWRAPAESRRVWDGDVMYEDFII